jgi:hypothetical protein
MFKIADLWSSLDGNQFRDSLRFQMKGLLTTCILAVLAQFLLISELDAQALIFSNGFENCTPGTTRLWDGGGDGVTWSSPANWQGDVLPVNGDSAHAQTSSPQTIIYGSSAGTRSIRCLDFNRPLSITGGNLEILQSGTVRSPVTVTGGTLKVTGTGRLRVVVQ